MLVEKKEFEIENFTFECGATIPLKMGYETYGTLNESKDNAILVAHFFSATSHAAGKYNEIDVVSGWWNGLIGPGKAVDTNKYFVICSDNICNIQPDDPMVTTTGPASINPKTNKPYGMSFPATSFKDIANAEKALIDSMGIKKLKAVMGPSAGGMISFQWAVNYPEMVERCIGVITNVQNPIITSFSVLQHAMRAIELDANFNNGDYYGKEQPIEGLALAGQMMTVGAFTPEFFEKMYPRDSKEDEPFINVNNKSSYERTLYETSINGAKLRDANSWLYTCKTTMNQDIARGFESLDEALKRISAKVLMIPCKQDLLQCHRFNRITVDRINELGGYAELYEIESEKGHMGGVLDTHLFADKVREFLDK